MPKRFVGVVWQEDLLLSNLTVYETIYYSAALKTSDQTKDRVGKIVDQTIEELGLSHVRNSLVGNALATGAATSVSKSKNGKSSGSGNARRGISGGERKRVSVACELTTNSSPILLDEPTSGLDASSAMALIQTLRDLADTTGLAICCAIHQPRARIFKF